MVKLEQLDMSNELDEYVFEEYCNAVYEVLLLDSPKWADSLVGAAKFKTVKLQFELRRRFRERMFCFVEKDCVWRGQTAVAKNGDWRNTSIKECFFLFGLVRDNRKFSKPAKNGEWACPTHQAKRFLLFAIYRISLTN